MINSLKNIFEELHQKHPNKFYFVDSTSLITKNDWRDEIHLTGKAYKKVAKAMHNRLCDIRNT